MNVLFVCNQGRHRSRTAAEMFEDRFDTRFEGLFANISGDSVSWADVIVVMEQEQRIELARRFPELLMQKRLLCLDVPDVFSYGQLELKQVLEMKLELLKPLLEKA